MKQRTLKNIPRSETTEQIGVIQWAERQQGEYPCLKWLHHCPNEGKRTQAAGATLKQMGIKSGVSDLFLPCPKGQYHGLYIELKYGDGKLTKEQKEFLTDMAAAGYYTCTCYTGQDATSVILEYINLSPTGRRTMRRPNNCIIKEGTVSGGVYPYRCFHDDKTF